MDANEERETHEAILAIGDVMAKLDALAQRLMFGAPRSAVNRVGDSAYRALEELGVDPVPEKRDGR